MKNIPTILSEYGITVPDDKKADFDKAIAANYKTVAEYDKQAGKLTAMTERAETAENTLKGFEGKDFEAITRERDEWKRKHEESEANHRREAEEREFNEILSAAITEATFLSNPEHARFLGKEKNAIRYAETIGHGIVNFLNARQ